MIGRLRGVVAAVRGDRVLLDVHGIGYEVLMTPKAIAGLPGVAEPATVHTHLHVREDGMSVYGFASEDERDLFRVLLGASGVGPRVALAILGTFSADARRTAVATEDVDALSAVPGIGKRTAQKIVLYLGDRLKPDEALQPVAAMSDTDSEVLAALTALGYSVVEAQAAIQSVPREAPDDVEERLRLALQYFQK